MLSNQTTEKQMFQWYKCEQCSIIQAVTLPLDCSILCAINKIKADHAEASPACSWNTDNITIYPNHDEAIRELNHPKEDKG